MNITKDTSMILSKLFIALIFTFQISFISSINAKSFCPHLITKFIPGINKSFYKQSLRNASATKLAQIIAVDDDSKQLISNPWIAQYIYINYFAEKLGQGEVQKALQDIVNSIEVKNEDLFELVNVTLAKKLTEPTVKVKINQAFASDDSALRPGKIGSKFTNMSATIKQTKALFSSIKKMKTLVDEGFSIEAMDQGLFDFYGATQLGRRDSQLRPWNIIPGGFSAIRPGQVKNIDPQLMSKMMLMASETEMPIYGYSVNSGESMRGFMPSVAAFLGKTQEQYTARITKENLVSEEGRLNQLGPFCTNVWCAEENRHEVVMEEAGTRISGQANLVPKTFGHAKQGDFNDANYAIEHLVGRNASEWSASSGYIFFSAHLDGAAKEWVENVRADETKHIAIFSTVFKYIYGNQYDIRMKGMLKKIMFLKNAQQTSNSNGDSLTASAISLFEYLISHLLVEKKMRDFLKSVPLKTMEKFFEAPPKTIVDIESDPIDPSKLKNIQEMIVTEKASRSRLARWGKKERKKYLDLKRVEKDYSPIIESLIRERFNAFVGAEVPGSIQNKSILKEINQLNLGLDKKTNESIKLSLRETLRDYQIMNNRYVRKQTDLIVEFVNASVGFIVKNASPTDSEILATRRLTNTHLLVRLKKPQGLIIKAGGALKVSINSINGTQSRILSLSNSPNDAYIEVAVGDSLSDFKRALAAIKKGSKVSVEAISAGLDFNKDVPAVMIAGGIGITPFRSIIQQANENGFPSSIKLLYANRTEIPFYDEFHQLAIHENNFNAKFFLSRPDEFSRNFRPAARISKKDLDDVVDSASDDTIFYIVANENMVQVLKKNLNELGVNDEKIVIESFGDNQQSGSNNLSKNSDNINEKKVAKAENGDDEMVCFCHSVTKGDILSAVASGASSLNEVADINNIGTGCGQCKCNAMEIISCHAKTN